MRLFDLLFPPRADELILRDISVDEFLAKVNPRLVSETRPGTVALLPFNGAPVRSAIHEAKYHGSEHAFKLLAFALADYLRDMDERPRRSFIVPVPLGKDRRKERGFNQVEEIAVRAAKQLGGAIDSTLLIRTRETTSQISLPRNEREKNMKGAFKAIGTVHSEFTYIIIDDVITTGATLQSAIDALKDAGAKHIIPLALAH